MSKIGIFLGLVAAAIIITMIFRLLRDRAARRRGTFSTVSSGDNFAPGASFSDRPKPDTSPSESSGGDGGGGGGD